MTKCDVFILMETASKTGHRFAKTSSTGWGRPFNNCELGDAQRKRLTQTLSKKYDKEVILRERVDEGLLGGLVIQVGDSRIDGSLRTRLQTIGSRLEAARFTSEDYYED